jgi:uncharacterized protein YjiS (DUF1127 family)
MTTLTAFANSMGRARWRSARVFGVINALLVRLAEEISVRRTMRQLSSFDDAMLRDIGLDRGSVEGAVRFGRPGREETHGTSPSRRGESPMPISFTQWR